MTTRNLVRRLERLEAEITPAYTEETIIRIILVSGDGHQEDSGIEYKIPAYPKSIKKRWR